MKIIKQLSIATLILLLFGCNKESLSDDPVTTSPSTSGAASFSCTVDGNPFVGVNVGSTTITKFTAPTYAMDGKRLDIRATNTAGEMIILTIVDYRDGTSGNSFRTGKHYFNLEENPIAGTANGDDVKGVSIFSRYSSSFSIINFSTGENSSVGSAVNVQSIDPTNKKVSGTFSGTLEDTDGTSFVVTNGKFNNMPFVVM